MYAKEARRIISYARVSTGVQAASGLSIAAQHGAVTDASAARGWQVVACVTDEAVSGSVPVGERPGLSTALAQLERGDADALIATPIDRLARDTLETLLLFDRAERSGWEILTLDAPDGVRTHNGRLLVEVLAMIATHEAGMARAHTKLRRIVCFYRLAPALLSVGLCPRRGLTPGRSSIDERTAADQKTHHGRVTVASTVARPDALRDAHVVATCVT